MVLRSTASHAAMNDRVNEARLPCLPSQYKHAKQEEGIYRILLEARRGEDARDSINQTFPRGVAWRIVTFTSDKRSRERSGALKPRRPLISHLICRSSRHCAVVVVNRLGHDRARRKNAAMRFFSAARRQGQRETHRRRFLVPSLVVVVVPNRAVISATPSALFVLVKTAPNLRAVICVAVAELISRRLERRRGVLWRRGDDSPIKRRRGSARARGNRSRHFSRADGEFGSVARCSGRTKAKQQKQNREKNSRKATSLVAVLFVSSRLRRDRTNGDDRSFVLPPSAAARACSLCVRRGNTPRRQRLALKNGSPRCSNFGSCSGGRGALKTRPSPAVDRVIESESIRRADSTRTAIAGSDSPFSARRLRARRAAQKREEREEREKQRFQTGAPAVTSTAERSFARRIVSAGRAPGTRGKERNQLGRGKTSERKRNNRQSRRRAGGRTCAPCSLPSLSLRAPLSALSEAFSL